MTYSLFEFVHSPIGFILSLFLFAAALFILYYSFITMVEDYGESKRPAITFFFLLFAFITIRYHAVSRFDSEQRSFRKIASSDEVLNFKISNPEIRELDKKLVVTLDVLPELKTRSGTIQDKNGNILHFEKVMVTIPNDSKSDIFKVQSISYSKQLKLLYLKLSEAEISDSDRWAILTDKN